MIKMVYFLPLLLFLLRFLLKTWCWINTFKRCYLCGLQSPLLAFWEHGLPGWLREPALHKLAISKCSRASTSNPHSLQQNSTLNGAILIFQPAQNSKSYYSVHMFIIVVLTYSMFLFFFDSICTRIFLFFSERMKLADDKMHLFGKCTGAQMYFCYWNLGKIIYRTWLMCCKFLSSICP